jgi:hypothetical protein
MRPSQKGEKNHNYRHGLTGSKIRQIWRHMLRRCHMPGSKAYKNYGGRGIKVCARWFDLMTFADDMGPPPPGMQLDRINNDGDYEPSNCRWVTPKENNRNRRSNRQLTFRGETKLISDWCKELGLKHPTVTNRLKMGWSVDDALTKPVGRWANAR